MINRRSFLLSPSFFLVGGLPVDAAISFRRLLQPGEDPDWYSYSQFGDYEPCSEPRIFPFGISKVVVHYPINVKSSRVVVFSHGSLSDPQVYRFMLQHLASHGFTVLAPMHDDSILEKGLLLKSEAEKGVSTWEVDRILQDSGAWSSRAEGCLMALDNLHIISNSLGFELEGDRTIFIGHELGAMTVQILMGVKIQGASDQIVNLKDDRVFASILLSPQGSGIMGLEDDSWSDISRPVVVIQGAQDKDFTGQDPIKKLDVFYKSKAGNKHLGWYNNGTRDLYVPKLIRSDLKSSVVSEDFLAFLTCSLYAYSKYDEKAFGLLTTDWADRSSLGRVQSLYR